MAVRTGEQESIQVRESAVEDVLALFPQVMSQILSVNLPISLVSRQMQLPSGRLDLLFLGPNSLFLIELKVEPFKPTFVEQILAYRNDLTGLQARNQLIAAPIESVLLCTSADEKDVTDCKDAGVKLMTYSPPDVLAAFLGSMAQVSNFLTIRPMDYGVWNIHLINRAIYSLERHDTVAELAKALGISTNSVRNHLKFAQELHLMSKAKGRYSLTPLGVGYLKARQPFLPVDERSEEQARLLREHIVQDPFASSVIFGIYSLVEAVFVLSRNTYPVAQQDVTEYFAASVGKKFEWSTPRSAFLGSRSFSNFAIELGLLGKVGDKLFLTPSGFRFILMLQLHKGIKIVDALNL